MRIVNQPGDAVLSLDGTVKVNRKIVGVWHRVYLAEAGRHFYYFALSTDGEPVVWAYFCHLFRAAIPKYLTKYNISIPQNEPVKKPSKPVEEMDDYEKKRQERKSKGASHSHVTRRLRNKEPLSGKSLKLALSIVGNGSTGDELRDAIAKKIIAGQPLEEYELHIMVDVLLPHTRLG